VEEVDSEHEVLQVTEAIGLSFEHFDFVVDAFHPACGNPMTKEVQDSRTVCYQLVSKFHNKFDSTGPGLLQPVGQMAFGLLMGLTVP